MTDEDLPRVTPVPAQEGNPLSNQLLPRALPRQQSASLDAVAAKKVKNRKVTLIFWGAVLLILGLAYVIPSLVTGTWNHSASNVSCNTDLTAMVCTDKNGNYCDTLSDGLYNCLDAATGQSSIEP
jgi:hypothetical protein